MKALPKTDSLFFKIIIIPVSMIISALCWYFSNGLTGNYWYLLWIAPTLPLLISFYTSAGRSLLIAFITYLIGRLSWFIYLKELAGILPAIFATITLSLIFALIVLATRKTVLKTKAWYSAFAYPVFFTTYEFLLINFSPDGSVFSIAYSQSKFLPLIQIASLTGILGITFLVTFLPSVLAICLFLRNKSSQLKLLLIIFSFIIMASLVYGFIRMSANHPNHTLVAGLAALEERSHNMDTIKNIALEIEHIKNYAEQVNMLAAKGAKLVVLPERAININASTKTAAANILCDVAKQSKVNIVTGFTDFTGNHQRNAAIVIDSNGRIVLYYNKVHLIKGLENRFAAGNNIGLFKLNNFLAGVAICKDLDFPAFISQYGKAMANPVCIPAWDFVSDDWLHSRMAILRGVENGFSEIRTARLGRLTISDCYGKVTAEANASNGRAILLTGLVSLERTSTIYARFGDWFGIIVTGAVVLFLFILARKPGTKDAIATI